MGVWSDLAVGVENVGHRSWLGLRAAADLGGQRWYWRLGYALWLESWRGPAHHAARGASLPPGWGSEDLIYGETPLWTAYRLLQWASLREGERFCEIGSGRGVVSLVAQSVFGARAIGYEVVPELAAKARWLARALEAAVEYREGGPVAPADLYYVTPTTWSQANWKSVTEELRAAPTGSRALVLTQPLPGWTVLEQKAWPYSWGWSQTFLQTKGTNS